MNKQNYKITCNKCGNSSRVTIINDAKIDYIDHTPIISARLRRDMQWGFECMCGNDTRIAKQEMSTAHSLIQGSSQQTVDAVIDKIKQSDDDTFIMEKQ